MPAAGLAGSLRALPSYPDHTPHPSTIIPRLYACDANWVDLLAGIGRCLFRRGAFELGLRYFAAVAHIREVACRMTYTTGGGACLMTHISTDGQ